MIHFVPADCIQQMDPNECFLDFIFWKHKENFSYRYVLTLNIRLLPDTKKNVEIEVLYFKKKKIKI